MNKIHVSAINRKIGENGAEFALECNRRYEKKLEVAVDRIADEYKEKPIILLSGPSGSGKTTSAFKIDEMLEKRGLKTHTVSMDDYFISNEEFVKKNEDIDYESPYRMDIDKLNNHMEMISRCEEVVMPRFEFSTQTAFDGEPYRRDKNEIVIFEGIHALNPLITGSASDYARCMYVSVRTRIELADGSLLHPSMIRLMRRIIRDGNFRGRSIEETLTHFDSVERGGNKYILPFKHRAEYSIDTFIPYEAAVYKSFLIDELEKIKDTYSGFEKYMPMLQALREIDEMDIDNIPANSLVREFIGGSCYEY